jgi:hypothetical protein
MNPAPVDGARNVFRVPQQPGDRRKRDQGAAEQFQRALQERSQHDGAAADRQDQPPAPPAPTPVAARPGRPASATAPAARALQRLLADGRREEGTPPRHVDVIA